eukprot:gene9617-1821_t
MKFSILLLITFVAINMASFPSPPNVTPQFAGTCGGTCVNSSILSQNNVMPTCGRIILGQQFICLQSGYTANSIREADNNVSAVFNNWKKNPDFWIPDTNDCEYSALTLLCSTVFQACSEDKTKRLKVCKSTCENYYDSCQAGELKDFRCEEHTYNGDYRAGQYVCTGTASLSTFSIFGLVVLLTFLLL